MHKNYYEVTEQQLAACERLEDSNGKPLYHVQSASDPDGFYTVRIHEGYKVWQCNCRAAREGVGTHGCWHVRAVKQAEAIEQDAYAAEQHAAAREAAAVRLDGTRAYERQAFSLLK